MSHTHCMLLVITLWLHQLRNEILTEHGYETMFFDEGSVKLKQSCYSVMNCHQLIVWFQTSAPPILIYINCHTWEVQGFRRCTHCPSGQGMVWENRLQRVRYLHSLVIIYTSVKATISQFLSGKTLTHVSRVWAGWGLLMNHIARSYRERVGALLVWLQWGRSN